MNFDIDFYEDDFDEDVESEYNYEDEPQDIKVFVKKFPEKVKELVFYHVNRYFHDKSMHCGGKIPRYMLRDSKRLSAVMNFDIMQGVELAYKSLEYLLEEDKGFALNGDSTEDIKLVTTALSKLSRAGVPQQFAGGMLLLHLEFIDGYKIYYN